MRVLIGCEKSAAIREAFAACGHDAWSCDLQPSERPGNHIIGDVRTALKDGWDLFICHPDCTHLAVSGALRFPAKQKDGRQRAAIDFFIEMANAPVAMVCVENPVCIMSTKYRRPDQIIQPWQFGDDASKATCLWLNGLAKLSINPAIFFPPRLVVKNGREYRRWSNQCDSGQNRLGPSNTRSAERARTYPGIARAMAEQWGTT